MKNKKIAKIFGAVLMAIVTLTCTVLFMGASCVGEKRDYAEVFELNWGVVLPENMQELFRKSEHNWGHFGTRYAVFVLEEEPSEFIEDFVKESNNKIENAVNNLLDGATFDIPEEYLPDWNEEYCWKLLEKEYYYDETDMVIDRCYIVYFINLKKLSICQAFV